MKRSLFLVCLVLLGLTTVVQAEQGNPKIKTIEAIRFGPNGLLIIGAGSDVVTVETGDTKGSTAWTKKEIDNIDAVLAGKLGLMAKDIEIRRIAVNPASGKLYTAVRSLKSNQYVILTIDGAGKIEEFSLENVKFEKYPLMVGEKAITKITDVTWAGGRIVAATQASDTFASRVFTIYPGKAATQFYTETYHTGHKQIETKAPILCLMPYEDGKKTEIVGSFTCTPLVKYPLDDAQPDVKVKGTTVVELGQGNQRLPQVQQATGRPQRELGRQGRFRSAEGNRQRQRESPLAHQGQSRRGRDRSRGHRQGLLRRPAHGQARQRQRDCHP
jgi:hypothetical protein